jgi:O-antigen/teichoic acid export membrane protein
MAVLSGGSAIGGFLALAATPLITRLYTPSEYGVLGVFASALSLFSVVAALRYDLAMPSAESDNEAAAILVVALVVVAATSFLCGVLVVTGTIARIMPATHHLKAVLTWSLPLGMAAVGVYAVLSNWMVRRGDFATLGKTKVAQVISMVGCQVGLGVARVGATGLIIGQIAGSSMGIMRLAQRILRSEGRAFSGLRLTRLRATAWKYRRFPMLSGPAVMFDALTGALPLLALASRFGSSSAGVFTIVQRVLLAPLALITTNLAQVIFGDLAVLERANSATMMTVFRRRLWQITLLGLAVTGVMLVVVPFVLPTILGPQWKAATTYFLIILPMMFAGFVSSPFGFAIDVLRRQDLHLLRDSARAFVLILALTLAEMQKAGPLLTLAIISAAGCINGAIYLGISWYAIACVKQAVSLAPQPSTDAMPAT